MFVIKRDGSKQEVLFDKITARIKRLSQDLKNVDVTIITKKTSSSLRTGMSTIEIDEHAASVAASMVTRHPEYSKLAARISISNHHKQIPKKFSEAMHELYSYTCSFTSRRMNLLSDSFFAYISENPSVTQILDDKVDLERDFKLSYFGFQTLKRNYFLKKDTKPIETYQYLLMRVAVQLHYPNIENIKKAYDYMSKQYYTHATPTLFNSGLVKPQLSSCFLMSTDSDSFEGIFNTVKRACLISKHAGGLGISISNISCVPQENSSETDKAAEELEGAIKEVDSAVYEKEDQEEFFYSEESSLFTDKLSGEDRLLREADTENATKRGLIPYLSILNATMRYADQGGSRRPGACAIYLEVWHADIQEFIYLRKNTGSEDKRCRDLFLALWVSDLFMQKVERDEDWFLFCPSEAPGLIDLYGSEFEAKYTEYVEQKLYRRKINARVLLKDICRAQIETGVPYMLYKDRCNEYSNQNNLGVIHSSNLCTEIVQFSGKDEVAVCNLASINLKAFIPKSFDKAKRLREFLIDDKETPESILKYYDFKLLREVVQFIVLSLNNAIDSNYYPIIEGKNSNERHRPMGIGVQGLANVFYELKVNFDSEAGRLLNVRIFESIYYACLDASNKLAQKHGCYSSFANSLYSKGILHFDHFFDPAGNLSENEKKKMIKSKLSPELNWQGLRSRIVTYGLRNSLFTCCMPTASTAQIIGNVESMEASTSNIYTRRVLAGDFVYINESLLDDLTYLNLWNKGLKHEMLGCNGSIQSIKEIPEKLRGIYKTVWEIPQKHIIEMAADRQMFLDQSQSLNIFMKDPSIQKIFNMHMFGWRKGLKTGMYYLRVQAAMEAIQFTVNKK